MLNKKIYLKKKTCSLRQRLIMLGLEQETIQNDLSSLALIQQEP